MTMIMMAVVRLALSIALLIAVYDETGGWTTTAFVLILLRAEGDTLVHRVLAAQLRNVIDALGRKR